MKNLIKKNQLMITALAIMIAIAGYLQFAGENLEEEYLIGEEGIASQANSDGVISENLTSGSVADSYSLDGMMDLSEEDLLGTNLTEIESLDSDVDILMEDYLDEDMQVADVSQQTEDGQQVADASQQTADGQQVADASQLTEEGQQIADASSQLAEAQPQEGEIPGEAVFTSTDGVAVLSDAKLLKEQTRAKNKETLLEIINSAGITEEQKQEAVNNMVEMTSVAEKEAAAEILLEAKGFEDVVVSINGDAVDVVVNAAELTDAQRAQIEDIVKRKTEVSAENIVISTVVQ